MNHRLLAVYSPGELRGIALRDLARFRGMSVGGRVGADDWWTGAAATVDKATATLAHVVTSPGRAIWGEAGVMANNCQVYAQQAVAQGADAAGAVFSSLADRLRSEVKKTAGAAGDAYEGFFGVSPVVAAGLILGGVVVLGTGATLALNTGGGRVVGGGLAKAIGDSGHGFGQALGGAGIALTKML